MDTGGYSHDNDTISQAMLEQTMLAIGEADMIIFMTDVRSGLTYLDLDMAKLLRRSFLTKPIFFAVNKVETPQLAIEGEAFRKTGFTNPYFISAREGSGVADMLDDIVKAFPDATAETEKTLPSGWLLSEGRTSANRVLSMRSSAPDDISSPIFPEPPGMPLTAVSNATGRSSC